MRTQTLLTILFGMLTASAVGETLESKYPLKKALDGQSAFEVSGGSKILLEQAGDATTVKLKGKVIATVQAPQFVRSLIQSENREFALLLIGKDRPHIGGVASDYHSILRMKFSKNGTLETIKRLLPKTGVMMSRLNRWIVKIDSVLNDGRTVRLNFGEQKSKDDPSMEMRYSWQVRDIVTGQLYRDDSIPEGD